MRPYPSLAIYRCLPAALHPNERNEGSPTKRFTTDPRVRSGNTDQLLTSRSPDGHNAAPEYDALQGV